MALGLRGQSECGLVLCWGFGASSYFSQEPWESSKSQPFTPPTDEAPGATVLFQGFRAP